MATAPWGIAVGAIFFIGEKTWDITEGARTEIKSQYLHLQNSLNNGWTPK